MESFFVPGISLIESGLSGGATRRTIFPISSKSLILFYQKVQQKENGRDTCCATPVVLRRPYLHRRECADEKDRDYYYVVHRMVCGADHYSFLFGSLAVDHLRVAVERALVLKSVE